MVFEYERQTVHLADNLLLSIDDEYSTCVVDASGLEVCHNNSQDFVKGEESFILLPSATKFLPHDRQSQSESVSELNDCWHPAQETHRRGAQMLHIQPGAREATCMKKRCTKSVNSKRHML